MLSADAARRLACDASIRRVVVSGKSEILDLGRSTATPSTGQRRALELRDGGCIWPGCDRPPGWCDAHHLLPYRRGAPDGGATDLDNLGLLCRRHHHLVHDEHFSVSCDHASGEVTVRRPDGSTASVATPPGPLTRRRMLARPGLADRRAASREPIRQHNEPTSGKAARESPP